MKVQVMKLGSSDVVMPPVSVQQQLFQLPSSAFHTGCGDAISPLRGGLSFSSSLWQTLHCLVRTHRASDGFASEFATSVDRFKADGKEKEIYMSLAMDMQMYIEKEKGAWFTKGRDEGINQGRNEERAALLLNMLKSGQTPEQISLSTNVPLEEVYSIQSRLSGK